VIMRKAERGKWRVTRWWLYRGLCTQTTRPRRTTESPGILGVGEQLRNERLVSALPRWSRTRDTTRRTSWAVSPGHGYSVARGRRWRALTALDTTLAVAIWFRCSPAQEVSSGEERDAGGVPTYHLGSRFGMGGGRPRFPTMAAILA
jgi:hypothetical protein